MSYTIFQKTIKEKDFVSLFFLLLFCFVFVFFSQIHPLIPFDGDDWVNLSHNRIAFVNLHEWNPTRILPHFLMPICGDIAAYVIYPIINDYLLAQTLFHAVVVSLFITIYIHSFYNLLNKKFQIEKIESIIFSLLFFSLHFLIFRSKEFDNQHLFYSQDLTCYYFYIVPNLINASAVLYIIGNDLFERINRFSSVKKGLLLLILYLSLCSNIYSSAILVIFLASSLLVNFPWKKARISVFLTYIRTHFLKVLTIISWFILGICEALGDRAKDIEEYDYSFLGRVYIVFSNFLLLEYNWLFVLLLLCAFLFLVLSYYRTKKIFNTFIILLVCSIISLCFIILINTQVYPHYVQRSEVNFSVFFPILCFMVLAFSIFNKTYKNIMMIMPLLLLLVITVSHSSYRTFRDLSIGQLTEDYPVNLFQIREAEDLSIKKIIAADQANQSDSLYIYVPDCGKGRVWPWTNYGYNSLNRTLLRHHLINKMHPGKFVLIQ